MKPISWDCCSSGAVTARCVARARLTLVAALWALFYLGLPAGAQERSKVVEPSSVALQLSSASEPSELGPDWRSGTVPSNWVGLKPGNSAAESALWYRVEFEVPAGPDSADSWALYLPYLYDGGRFWLNGQPLTAIAQSTAATHLRWERPRLITIADNQLKAGRNELLLRSIRYGPRVGVQLQHIAVGPTVELLPMFDRRMFWVRTMPQYAVVTCLVVGLFVTSIWWRRRDEVLYGLFGLAAILWSVRTLTFVVEVMPAEWWPWWRAIYHSATGGFIVVLALFAMRFAGMRRPLLERAMFAYWLAGPVLMLASGGALDAQIGRIWTVGMIPIGLSMLVFAGYAAWRQRTGAAIALFSAMVLGVLAGIHDYMVAWDGMIQLPAAVRSWLAHRIFLLHHAANLLLLVMVAILTMRFVQTLDGLADLNRHLEERVHQREKELVQRHAQVSRLSREQAVSDERQRIMQDLHDGLGSQMFIALARVERGGIEPSEITQMLRDCIADMRLTFELIAPEQFNFSSALGNLRFRWEAMLKEAGVSSHWNFDGLKSAGDLTPASALHVLRITQEALTNVLKHARARHVSVTLQVAGNHLMVSVEDDGCGIDASAGKNPGARGLSSMKHRARRLGAVLQVSSEPNGTRITLDLPLTNGSEGALQSVV
jgi:signal transduction histidine kinase